MPSLKTSASKDAANMTQKQIKAITTKSQQLTVAYNNINFKDNIQD